MELTLQQKLECPFPEASVSWRIGSKSKDKAKARLLAYIDARDVMDRLDAACGFGDWQCRYPLSDNGLLICDVGIRVDDEWLWRSNGAGDTQVEAEKGKCSDAFKRAAVLWGVGRYLYSLPSPWVEIDEWGKWTTNPRLPVAATVNGYMSVLNLSLWDKPTLKKKYLNGLLACVGKEDAFGVRELWDEMNTEQQQDVWNSMKEFSTQRAAIKTLLSSVQTTGSTDE